jgi:pimeloyl-ACP methyl ester carboxylesterase
VNSHYVEAGDGPLVVLLHGFPEFWYGWRRQIAPLAAAGFESSRPTRVGYNLSSKPEGFKEYGVDLLADDIRGLIGELGAESAMVVGHDWGGSIAWTVAMNPEVVDRLAILNAAPPAAALGGTEAPKSAAEVLVLLLLRDTGAARGSRYGATASHFTAIGASETVAGSKSCGPSGSQDLAFSAAVEDAVGLPRAPRPSAKPREH